jgi:UDP-N-acetylglucosamine 1-carboxyvinyltransferase
MSSTNNQTTVQPTTISTMHQNSIQDAIISVNQSQGLAGEASLTGAKNAVLVIIASLILTEGKSILTNVPYSDDVLQMIALMRELGAHIVFDSTNNRLEVETSFISSYKVSPTLMKKMRASVLVMGPLLARFSKAEVALPGGCLLGARPIDYHIKNFEKMGVVYTVDGEFLTGSTQKLKPAHIVLDYPSVGATENLLMAAVLTSGTTRIINAALEPEVLDLIDVLRKMGSTIAILPPATLEIVGVAHLQPIEHQIIHDRLEAGALLLAAAITGGTVYLPDACADRLDVFLLKLQEMGHHIEVGQQSKGIRLIATKNPRAVSFTTAPYPGFPTDLQAPMMAAQCLAAGKSEIHETVFENRFLHVRELQKMGAQITIKGDRAFVTGVETLYGAHVIATDIRASCALVLAGLAAQGTTTMTGVNHWKRGYESLEKKLAALGASIMIQKLNH